MSFHKVKNLEDQLLKIKMHLPAYLGEHGIDVMHGRKINCLSPLHNDNSPSMSMFTNKDTGVPLLKCQSCSVTYDLFNVCHVLEHRPIMGPSFIDDTVMYLAKKYDIELELAKMSADEIYEMDVYSLYRAISKYITEQSFNVAQLHEITRRGWTETFARSIGIGVCNDISAMRDYLKDLGFSYKFMDENDLDHDRLFSSSTLVFTICDEHGRPVTFSARNMLFDGVKDDSGRLLRGTKFINSKVNGKCSIGKKSELLYLFNIARHKATPVYIFEGNADVVTAHSYGLQNSVAICGLGLNETHLNLCRRSSVYDVVICLDNDGAGLMKAKQILDDALKKVHDIKIRFVFLPDKTITVDGVTQVVKTDPDEFIRENGIEAFIQLPKIDPFAWRLQQYDMDQDADSESICMSMVPIIAAEPSAIKREGMCSELADYTAISCKAIKEEVDKIVNADDLKISKAKQAVVADLLGNLTSETIGGVETILSSALSKLESIDKEFKSNTLDVQSRLADILGIKQYQETEELTSQINLGPEFSTLNYALDGELKQKLLLLGASENCGKTSLFAQLSTNIVDLNPNAMTVWLTIDDSKKEVFGRILCSDVAKRLFNANRDLFDLLSINKVSAPHRFKDSVEYDALLQERDISCKKILSLAAADRYVLLDAEDGTSLDYIEMLLKYYSEKYPDRHLFFFLD